MCQACFWLETGLIIKKKKMDLPFAVDSSPDRRSTLLNHSNASSLVTASSQGSLLPADDSPEHSGMYSSPDNSFSNTIISPGVVPADAELNDFTYVNVCETDADEVDVLMDGRVPLREEDLSRGDVLAVLLSGGTQEQDDGESIVVSGTYTASPLLVKALVQSCFYSFKISVFTY